MNLGNQFTGPRIIHRFMQPSTIFDSQDVSEYCAYRERQIAQEIHRIPHSEILSSDRETLFTKLVNSYLSDESTDYPALDMDKDELLRDSNLTTVTVLYQIPWTGDEGFFVFKPVSEYDLPSTEVTIHLDQVDKEVTFYYVLPLHDGDKSLEERLQALLKNDIAWVVNSLDDVVRHFRDHESRLKSIMGKALAQRAAAVASIEGLMERIEVPEEIFKNKLSVSGDPIPSRERHPRYDVFKPLLFGLQRGQCNGTKFEILYSEATVDHIVPQAAGGGDELENLQVLCSPCNGLKDDGPQDAYMTTINHNPSFCSGHKTLRERCQ